MNAGFLLAAVGLALLAAALLAWPLWRLPRGEGSRTGQRIGAVALIVLLPLAVLSMYTQVTSYPWDNPERLTEPAPGAPEQVARMVSELAAKMAAEPTVEGLTMLGRSYIVLERHEEAVDAYHRAWELTEGQDPMISISYAEALILSDRDSILTSAGDLLDAALQQAPFEPRALWYGGLAARSRGQTELAQQRFATLLNNPEIPEQLRMVVQNQLASLTPETAAPVGQDASTPVTELSITVAVSDELAARAGDTPVMFVFARESGEVGAPVAVKRIRVREFPVELILSDADAMVAGRKLGDIDVLQLTARISATGNAIAAPGDLYGDTVSGNWQSATTPLILTIDRIVE